jgi:hypothetical protein
VLFVLAEVSLFCAVPGPAVPSGKASRHLHCWARLFVQQVYYLLRLAIYIYAVAATELSWLACTSWYVED